MQKVWMFALAVFVGMTALVAATALTQDQDDWDVPEDEKTVENPLPADDDVIADGATLYQRNCRMCHGETGKGDGSATSGLLTGATIGIDATTLEANAAMRSIVRRDTGEGYQAYLTGLAEASARINPRRARPPGSDTEEEDVESGGPRREAA